jgi:LAS superfamily LD-carboxypeptidase LdcB
MINKKLISEINRNKELMGIELLNETLDFVHVAGGKKARITSPFGPRGGSIHYGLDLGVPSGTKVIAPADGTITDAVIRKDACGGTLKIDHGKIDGDDYDTRFCHCKEFLVNIGDKVTQGQVIAYSGGGAKDIGRGRSTGAHIHFELYKNGTPINPKSYYDNFVELDGMSQIQTKKINKKIESFDDIPEDLKKIYSKLESKSGRKYKIEKENIDFEFKNEGGIYKDAGSVNSEAKKQIMKMIEDMIIIFPELKSETKLVSDYRGYEKQISAFLNNIGQYATTLDRQKWSALPGFSQHHTGKAFDIFSVEKSWWKSRPEIKKWVEENCKNYGFEVSYPTDRGSNFRGAEPWHLKYVSGAKIDSSDFLSKEVIDNSENNATYSEKKDVEKLLDKIGLKQFADSESLDDVVQKVKDMVPDEVINKTPEGDIEIFGYSLSDLWDNAKSIFEQRLNEDINKMKKPLK